MAYTSVLKRAIRTLWLALDEMDQHLAARGQSPQLNERHYGGLQGSNKADMAKQYGDEQSADQAAATTPAPARKPTTRAANVAMPLCGTATEQIPLTECLKDTVARVIPSGTRDGSAIQSASAYWPPTATASVR